MRNKITMEMSICQPASVSKYMLHLTPVPTSTNLRIAITFI